MFAGEHPAEFQLRQLGFEIGQFSLRFDKSLFVFRFNRQLNQTRHIFQALIQFIDSADDLLQCRTLFAKRLRFLRIVPDRRIFKLAGDFF
jgi:hypothetical protein